MILQQIGLQQICNRLAAKQHPIMPKEVPRPCGTGTLQTQY